jgi:hypothetical protein
MDLVRADNQATPDRRAPPKDQKERRPPPARQSQGARKQVPPVLRRPPRRQGPRHPIRSSPPLRRAAATQRAPLTRQPHGRPVRRATQVRFEPFRTSAPPRREPRGRLQPGPPHDRRDAGAGTRRSFACGRARWWGGPGADTHLLTLKPVEGPRLHEAKARQRGTNHQSEEEPVFDQRRTGVNRCWATTARRLATEPVHRTPH